jgi:hypothetical protein
MADTETLDDLVRRVDPDRWLAAGLSAMPPRGPTSSRCMA